MTSSATSTPVGLYTNNETLHKKNDQKSDSGLFEFFEGVSPKDPEQYKVRAVGRFNSVEGRSPQTGVIEMQDLERIAAPAPKTGTSASSKATYTHIQALSENSGTQVNIKKGAQSVELILPSGKQIDGIVSSLGLTRNDAVTAKAAMMMLSVKFFIPKSDDEGELSFQWVQPDSTKAEVTFDKDGNQIRHTTETGKITPRMADELNKLIAANSKIKYGELKDNLQSSGDGTPSGSKISEDASRKSGELIKEDGGIHIPKGYWSQVILEKNGLVDGGSQSEVPVDATPSAEEEAQMSATVIQAGIRGKLAHKRYAELQKAQTQTKDAKDAVLSPQIDEQKIHRKKQIEAAEKLRAEGEYLKILQGLYPEPDFEDSGSNESFHSTKQFGNDANKDIIDAELKKLTVGIRTVEVEVKEEVSPANTEEFVENFNMGDQEDEASLIISTTSVVLPEESSLGHVRLEQTSTSQSDDVQSEASTELHHNGEQLISRESTGGDESDDSAVKRNGETVRLRSEREMAEREAKETHQQLKKQVSSLLEEKKNNQRWLQKQFSKNTKLNQIEARLDNAIKTLGENPLTKDIEKFTKQLDFIEQDINAYISQRNLNQSS